MNGWIKMHRKLKLWEWYNDHNTTRLFIHLLLSVNSKVGVHQGVEIPVGCVKTGRKELAKQIGLSEQQIRRSLNNLQKSQDITIKPTNKFSLISVVNWDEYQSTPEKITNKRADKQPANEPDNNHKQEVKNKEVKSSPLDFFAEQLSPSRLGSLELWLEYKAEKKQSYKPRGLKALITSLEPFSDKWISDRVTKAMSNNWNGMVFSEDKPKRESKYTKDNGGSVML